jgi:integrase
MSATAVAMHPSGRGLHPAWTGVDAHAPQLVATARRYIDQIELSLRPNTILKADEALRVFATYLVIECPAVAGFADVGRAEVEGFKADLGRYRTAKGSALSSNTLRQRLGMLRTFFDRIIEWDWPDAPARNPIFGHDLPVADDPLPRFLDDAAAARLLRVATADPDPLRRLVIELLIRTGLRVGELCDLEADAVHHIGDGWWLKVPLGKLRNDRYVPLHPQLVELLAEWVGHHDHAGTGRLLTREGRPLNRHVVTRICNRLARQAGIGRIHPHQLRHTMATQAINRGMRLEAIAAILGHRSLKMTMTYARIANRTVADEYQAANEQVEALYADPADPATASETPAMRRLRSEHRRMLGNGWCTRPPELDCTFETICEGCGFFATTVEFRPTLQAQRDHAGAHDQPGRRALYDNLLASLDADAAGDR